MLRQRSCISGHNSKETACLLVSSDNNLSFDGGQCEVGLGFFMDRRIIRMGGLMQRDTQRDTWTEIKCQLQHHRRTWCCGAAATASSSKVSSFDAFFTATYTHLRDQIRLINIPHARSIKHVDDSRSLSHPRDEWRYFFGLIRLPYKILVFLNRDKKDLIPHWYQSRTN